MDSSAKGDSSDNSRATRRIRTLAEKLSILEEVDRPGASIAAVARRHGINANLLFAWRRLHQRGALEAQRHAPPLLPVEITSPTITPTQRTNVQPKRVPRSRTNRMPEVHSGAIEIMLPGDVRVRLSGEAERVVLAQILEWLPRR
jgi:transposase